MPTNNMCYLSMRMYRPTRLYMMRMEAAKNGALYRKKNAIQTTS